MLPALNIVINLVLCFFLYHVPSVYHAACFWWGALISHLKRGWFQLIPGLTSLLSAAAWCCPHFPRNFFSASISYCFLARRAVLWARQLFRQMFLVESSLAAPVRRGGQEKDFPPLNSVCTGRPGLAAQLFRLLCLWVFSGNLREFIVRPGLWNGPLAQLDSWAGSTWVDDFWKPEREREGESPWLYL